MIALIALLAVLGLGPQDEPLEDIRSKDAATREAAARALADDASPSASNALAKAASDDEDLLVVLASLDGLDGRELSKEVRRALVGLALESPFIRIRDIAAATLGRLDAATARAEFLDEAAGKKFTSAATALALSLEAAEGTVERTESEMEKELRKIAREIESKDHAERVAAARALVAAARGDAVARPEQVREIVVDRAFTDEDAELVCAALDSIAAAPDPTDVDTLRPLLLSEEFPTSVVARRLERAFARTIADLSADDQSATLLAAASEAPAASARIARVASFPDVRVDAKTEVFTQLLGTDDVDARAAAAKGLDALGEEGADLALGALEDASEARVQLQLVRILDRRAALVDEEEGEAGAAVKALIGLLKDGVSDPVREAAAVALGREGIHRTAVSALAQAAADGEGEVAITAAIALGRTRADDALGPLRALTERESWMVRASAAEGLKQLSRPECVPPLLALLLDENAAVRATAHRALLRFSDREGQEVEFEEWPGWWQENAKRAKFRTREEERELAEKYGYGVDERTIYRGLDVVVVPGRGDHIELVLERLEIKYRIARGGQLAEAGLHPGAILLVGCTGEITPDDVDIVRWYVHAGGALFTSCWALTYTVEPAFPAVLAKFPSPGEVVDNVFAFPAIGAADSPYLRGVFDGGVRPYYSLLGAHLVEVLDPERAEVLLDSPTAAARHGTGDLAAWFRSGHGVVLDTANHFEEQGFSAASGLRKPIDRQAFAIDHMGLAPTKLRELVDEKWWRSTSKAAEEVLDLSVFRILTNFVREKRIRG